jgi:polysaccharide export outer membrane protein
MIKLWAISFCFFLAPLTLADVAYTLKEGDILKISVWGEEKLQQVTRILPDGSISFPLVGNLKASGLSAPEVEAAISKGLAKFIPDVEVSVVVQATEGNRVFVLGKVKEPGAFVMTSPLTAMQALSIAGGLDTFADESDILILRQSSEGQSKLEVNYDEIISGENLSTNHQLQAGDTLLVP